MDDESLQLEEDLGEATIVYEGSDGEPVETTVPNEHIAYFQDHWLIKADEDEQGRDRVRRIPAYRVYSVERSVEEFEDEIKTLRARVQSVADDLRTMIPLGGEQSGGDVHQIDVDSGEPGGEGERDR